MMSRLEHILLRYGSHNGNIRRQILDRLNHDRGVTLRRLRAASRVLCDLVDHHLKRCFHTLFLTIPFLETNQTTSLKTLAPHCRTLVITIKHRQTGDARHDKTAPASSNAKQAHSRRDLVCTLTEVTQESIRRLRGGLAVQEQASVLGLMPTQDYDNARGPRAEEDLSTSPTSFLQRETSSRILLNLLPKFDALKALVIRIPGSDQPLWPGQTLVEKTLLILRGTIEAIFLSPPFPFSRLRSIVLHPIHIMGIIHLNWTGLSSFCAASPPPVYSTQRQLLWQNITTLEIGLHNPFVSPLSSVETLSRDREIMVKKMLYTYLKSFGPTIKDLRFTWLPPSSLSTTASFDELNGPSPFLLHLDLNRHEDCQDADLPMSNSWAEDDNKMLRRSRVEAIEDKTHCHRKPLFFPKLVSLSLANVSSLLQTADILPVSAPNCKFFHVLRPSRTLLVDSMVPARSQDTSLYQSNINGHFSPTSITTPRTQRPRSTQNEALFTRPRPLNPAEHSHPSRQYSGGNGAYNRPGESSIDVHDSTPTSSIYNPIPWRHYPIIPQEPSLPTTQSQHRLLQNVLENQSANHPCPRQHRHHDGRQKKNYNNQKMEQANQASTPLPISSYLVQEISSTGSTGLPLATNGVLAPSITTAETRHNFHGKVTPDEMEAREMGEEEGEEAGKEREHHWLEVILPRPGKPRWSREGCKANEPWDDGRRIGPTRASSVYSQETVDESVLEKRRA